MGKIKSFLSDLMGKIKAMKEQIDIMIFLRSYIYHNRYTKH